MKIRVERDNLADAVAWVAKSLPTRPSVPVLGGVPLDAGGDDGDGALTVSGFDYEVSATVSVSATIAEGGKVLVSGRLLADITKALPAQPVDITVDGARVGITCGAGRAFVVCRGVAGRSVRVVVHARRLPRHHEPGRPACPLSVMPNGWPHRSPCRSFRRAPDWTSIGRGSGAADGAERCRRGAPGSPDARVRR